MSDREELYGAHNPLVQWLKERAATKELRTAPMAISHDEQMVLLRDAAKIRRERLATVNVEDGD